MFKLLAVTILLLVAPAVVTACRADSSHQVASDRASAGISLPGFDAAALARNGIYLGPPGQRPVGVPPAISLSPPTTATVEGTLAGSSSVGPLQSSVLGDPADGTSKIDSDQALAIAKQNAPGFVGPSSFGSPVLVQFVDVASRPSVEATTWAIVVTGSIQLSGPAETGSDPQPAAAVTTPSRALIFIDAVTGNFITELGGQ